MTGPIKPGTLFVGNENRLKIGALNQGKMLKIWPWNDKWGWFLASVISGLAADTK